LQRSTLSLCPTASGLRGETGNWSGNNIFKNKAFYHQKKEEWAKAFD